MSKPASPHGVTPDAILNRSTRCVGVVASSESVWFEEGCSHTLGLHVDSALPGARAIPAFALVTVLQLIRLMDSFGGLSLAHTGSVLLFVCRQLCEHVLRSHT